MGSSPGRSSHRPSLPHVFARGLIRSALFGAGFGATCGILMSVQPSIPWNSMIFFASLYGVLNGGSVGLALGTILGILNNGGLLYVIKKLDQKTPDLAHFQQRVASFLFRSTLFWSLLAGFVLSPHGLTQTAWFLLLVLSAAGSAAYGGFFLARWYRQEAMTDDA